MVNENFKSYKISEKKSEWLRCLTGKELKSIADKHNISVSLIRHVIGLRRTVQKSFLPVLNDLERLAKLKDSYKKERSKITKPC